MFSESEVLWPLPLPNSRIRNDPNAWFPHQEAFISAVARIVHLSAETVRIVERLPAALQGVEEG